MTVHAGSSTDVGLVRSGNEDSVLARDGLYVVADGMGGHAAGEVASGIVVEALAALAERMPVHPDDVLEQLQVANQRIRDAVAADSSRAGMGTTAAGVVRVETGGTTHWAVVNIGDSRVYRWIGGDLRRVTVDHSEVQELQDAGVITADEARRHPLRHVVTRSLGGHERPKIDLWVLPPWSGERFVVCSDGLTNEVVDDDIRAILGEGLDAQRTAEALVQAALDGGGRDNVSVIVVDTESSEDIGSDEDTAPRARATTDTDGD